MSYKFVVVQTRIQHNNIHCCGTVMTIFFHKLFMAETCLKHNDKKIAVIKTQEYCL